MAGTKTSDKALHETIISWQKKGFYSGFTDAAGREWRADSYARAIIKTTTYRVYNEMRTRPAEELGELIHFTTLSNVQRAQHAAQFKGK